LPDKIKCAVNHYTIQMTDISRLAKFLSCVLIVKVSFKRILCLPLLLMLQAVQCV